MPIKNTKISKEAESQGFTITSNKQKSKLESQLKMEDDINTTSIPIIQTSKIKTSEEESKEWKAIEKFDKSIRKENEK